MQILSEQQVIKQRNYYKKYSSNIINIMERSFDFMGRLADDDCALITKELQNQSIGDYNLYNSYMTANCETDKTHLDTFVAQNPNLRYKDGFGFLNGCVVDADSKLRNGALFTNDREKSQLCTRWHKAVPALSKGGLTVNVDSRLKFAEDTSAIRECDRLSERNFNRFVPMTPCLASSIQDPENIVPQWQWGGESTRQSFIQENQHMNQCGFTKTQMGYARNW
jgi:hypothetical protein